jgi:hypothetical protein
MAHDRPTSGRDVIAVIGIDRYASWPLLSNAASDARGTLELFRRLGFIELAPSLFDEQATGDAMQRLVRDRLYTELENADRLVLFFAGHGHTQETAFADGTAPTGFIIPVNAAANTKESSSWVRLDTWLSDVARLPAMHILVIIDACRSGIALGSLVKYRDIVAPEPDGLASLRARRSRRIITSAMSDQVAIDSGPVAGHSLFTGCLIEGLTGAIARDGATETTGSELGLYLQRRVREYSQDQQTPDFGALEHDRRGELVIPLVADRLEPEPPPPPPPEPTTRWWLVAIAAAGVAVIVGATIVIWKLATSPPPPDASSRPAEFFAVVEVPGCRLGTAVMSNGAFTRLAPVSDGRALFPIEQNLEGTRAPISVYCAGFEAVTDVIALVPGGVAQISPMRRLEHVEPTSPDSTPTPPAPRCGDRHVDPGEDCDDGPAGSESCSRTCKRIRDADCYQVAGGVVEHHDRTSCTELDATSDTYQAIRARQLDRGVRCKEVFDCKK